MIEISSKVLSNIENKLNSLFIDRLMSYLLSKYPKLIINEDDVKEYISDAYLLDIKKENYLRAYVELRFLLKKNVLVNFDYKPVQEVILKKTISDKMKTNFIDSIIKDINYE